MCAGRAEVTDIISTMKRASSQKGAFRCWRTERGTGGVLGWGRSRCTPCSSQACSGVHSSSWRAANAHKVGRQPHSAIHQLDSGMNTVLASPPRKVSEMMWRRKLLGWRSVSTAKAGV